MRGLEAQQDKDDGDIDMTANKATVEARRLVVLGASEEVMRVGYIGVLDTEIESVVL